MEQYFKHQAALAAVKSDFYCAPDCDAPGCVLEDVVVEVTLFDLMRLSLAVDVPVSKLFLYHCRIGLQTSEFNARYLRLMIKLNKPCPFLQNRRCVVHTAKPLNCVLFPEYHRIKNLLSDLSRLLVFRQFPCLKGEIAVSEARAAALEALRAMSRKEEGLSLYYLLQEPMVLVDVKSLTQTSPQKESSAYPLSIRDLDHLLQAKLNPTGLLEEIAARISRLDTRAGMHSLFEKLADDALIKTLLLKMETPEVVYSLKRNRWQKLKRYPRRPEATWI